MLAALRLSRLTRLFGRTRAVDDVSLRVEAGQAVAILGPNGAGKSTLMRLAAGLLRPTRGSVHIFDLDLRQEDPALRRRIGFLSHDTLLYGDLTPIENLSFYGRLYGVTDLQRRIAELVDRLALGPWANRPVRTLSRGAAQRGSLARVLLLKPDLVFLDEPFTGLDVEGARILDEALLEARDSGATLLLSTHHFSQVVQLCERTVVLCRGRIAWDGPIESRDAMDLHDLYRRVLEESSPRRVTPSAAAYGASGA